MTETREIVLRLQLEYPPDRAPEASAVATTDQPLLYRVREAARILAVGESAVYELIARGELEAVKIGTSRRVTRVGLEQYVRRLAAGGGGGNAPAA